MRRPLASVLIPYIAGIFCHALPLALSTLYLLAVVLLSAVFFTATLRRVALYALVFFCGWINSAQRGAVLSPYDLRQSIAGEKIIATIEGTLLETPKIHSFANRGREGWTSSTTIHVKNIRFQNGDWKVADGTIACLTLDQLPSTIYAGQTVQIEGVLGPVPGPVAEGLFDYRKFRDLQGIYYELETKSVKDWRILYGPKERPVSDRFLEWGRQAISCGFKEPDEIIRLEWALTLGIRAYLTDAVAEPFVRASTYHIFAVDGLRIAIVSGMLLAVLKYFGIRRSHRGLITLPFLICYAALTGWPASAIRAIVMISVIFSSWWLLRPTDFLNSLLTAALIILVYDPLQLFQAGFQLSFVVVWFLVQLMPRFETFTTLLLRTDPLLPESLLPRWKIILLKYTRGLIELLFSSVAAMIASLPLTAQYFHVLTPYGFIANVIAIPLCMIVLILNIASMGVIKILPDLSFLLNKAAWWSMCGIRFSSSAFAKLPGACFNVPEPGWIFIILFYTLLAIALTAWFAERKGRAWKFSSWLVVFSITLGLWRVSASTESLTVLPCRRAQVVFLSQPGFGNDWLVDCGNESSFKSAVKPFLQSRGVNQLGNLVLTHGESGFTAAADDIIGVFSPSSVFISTARQLSPTLRETISRLDKSKHPAKILKTGENIGPWQILHPQSPSPSLKAGDNVMVLRGNFHGMTVLLLSALNESGQKDFLKHSTNLASDIIVASVPAEGQPLIDTLLDNAKPQVIILSETPTSHSSDFKQDFRHRLLSRGVPVFFTQDSGAVTIEFHDYSCVLKSMDGTRTVLIPAH